MTKMTTMLSQITGPYPITSSDRGGAFKSLRKVPAPEVTGSNGYRGGTGGAGMRWPSGDVNTFRQNGSRPLRFGHHSFFPKYSIFAIPNHNAQTPDTWGPTGTNPRGKSLGTRSISSYPNIHLNHQWQRLN